MAQRAAGFTPALVVCKNYVRRKTARASAPRFVYLTSPGHKAAGKCRSLASAAIRQALSLELARILSSVICPPSKETHTRFPCWMIPFPGSCHIFSQAVIGQKRRAKSRLSLRWRFLFRLFRCSYLFSPREVCPRFCQPLLPARAEGWLKAAPYRSPTQFRNDPLRCRDQGTFLHSCFVLEHGPRGLVAAAISHSCDARICLHRKLHLGPGRLRDADPYHVHFGQLTARPGTLCRCAAVPGSCRQSWGHPGSERMQWRT